MAGQQTTLPMWARALAIVVGLVSIAAAFIVLLFPGIAVLTLVLILGIALMFMGIDRLAAGISGHARVGVVVIPVGPVEPANSTPGTPRTPP
jgi:uncharacterized membrane protein HdeD (DUF308 family)